MRRCLLAAAALLLAATARADEYPAQPRPPPSELPPPYVTVFEWSGFYVGGHLGVAISDSPFSSTATSLDACTAVTGAASDCQAHGNVNSNGLAGGLQAGFTQQIGHLVWGLEGDVTWRAGDGKAAVLPAFGAVQQFAESSNWLITLRPRLGFSYYRAFLYATGGVAWGGVRTSAAFADGAVLPALTAHEAATRTGWTVGTGLEYELASHLSFKGEFLFVDLGSESLSTPAAGGWFATSTRFSEQEHILRAGLNYRF
jgi:outer membrane immunogenic protein